MDKSTPSSQPATPSSEPVDKIGRRLTKFAVLLMLAAVLWFFCHSDQGAYRLSMVDVSLSFLLAIVPGVIIGLLGLHFLEPEGEGQAEREKSARKITQMWAVGMGSALLKLVLRLTDFGLQAHSELHWFGGLALTMALIWFGAAIGMVAQADPRKLNQYLPGMILAATMMAAVGLVIATYIAWQNW